MKPRSTSRFSRADRDEAALWAARLDGGAFSANDHAELERWMQGDPQRRSLLAAYCQFSVDLEQQLPAVLADRPAAPRPEHAMRPSRWRRFSVAAGLAAAVVFGSVWWTAREREQPATIATAAAERQTVTLSDGTRADLNAQTTLRVDFRHRARRIVHLENGEALFTVAKNPERPFVVETAGGRVRVTGTIFNLRADPRGRLEVSVLEGSVEVEPRAAHAASTSPEPLRLVPGDQVAVTNGQVEMRRARPEAAAETAAWRDGQVVFDDLPLGEALARFTAYHRRPLAVAPEAAHLRVGGRYSLDDLDGFLGALERVLPVRVERAADGAVRVVAREP